jgi:formylglycine-generating enzyme required for sulfatase activity
MTNEPSESAGARAQLQGAGAVAQGQGATALAQGAVQVQGDNHAPITVLIEQGRQPGASATALRQAYLARLMLQLDQLPLAGAGRGSDQVRLTSVYTALLTQRGKGDEQGMDAARGRVNRAHQSALEVLNAERCLVLLGGPGSGKTTFAAILALSMAGELLDTAAGPNLATLTAPLPNEDDSSDSDEKPPEPQPWQHGPLLPVQIVLRDLAAQLPAPGCPIDTQVVWRYLARGLAAAQQDAFEPHLKAELQDRGGLVIFDGLDEVPDALQRREQIKQAVQQFTAAFPNCRVLVTSRTYAYQNQHWKLNHFAEVQLLPFTRAQQHAFVDAWYAHMVALLRLTEPAARDRAERLKREADRNPRIGELAERPLLLTLMAQLQTEGGGELPEKREALYDRAVEMLLNQWENTKVHVREDGSRELQPSLAEWLSASREAIRTQLNRLAFEAHRDQPQLVGTADITQDRLIAALRAASSNPDVRLLRLEEYLRDRAGLLAPHGEGLYQFPHRSFQEYLAACHLTDDDFPEQIARLARQDPNRWREVTLLAGAKAARGSKSSAWELAEALHCHELDEAVTAPAAAQRWGDLLAGHALAECADLSQTPGRKKSLRTDIVQAQLALLRDPAMPAVERALAGRSLAALGDPRPEVMTVDGMPFCWVPAGPFTMGSEEAFGTATPVHDLDIPYAYLMARYPVTVAQWNEFLQASGDPQVDERSRQGRTNDPVLYVDLGDVRRFCHWLTQRWQARLPAGWEVTLPSEAEWEKAARGGEQVPQAPLCVTADQVRSVLTDPATSALRGARAQEFPWDDEFDAEHANCVETGLGQTSAVGAFPGGTSPYGCEEMAGNVWEWTRSLWGEDIMKPEFAYPYDLGDARREDLDAPGRVLRVVRGGAFNNAAVFARCAARLRARPDGRHDCLGFRVVLRCSPV